MYDRKLKRRHLIYYLRVSDAVKRTLIGYIADISIDGIMIMSEMPIPVDIEKNCREIIDAILNKN